jgi:hypothetical protein
MGCHSINTNLIYNQTNWIVSTRTNDTDFIGISFAMPYLSALVLDKEGNTALWSDKYLEQAF